MAVEVTQVVFWKIDMPSQAVVFDQGSLPVLGLEPDEALTTLQGWMANVHPDDLGLFTERLTAALQPGDPVFDLEYRMRRRSGGYQWMHTKGSVIQRSADGRPEIAVGTSMNITARKREQIELEIHRQHLEELVQQRTTELLATEARASRILDSAADGLYGVDLQGRITFINAAACRLLGCTAQQAVGRTAHELFHVGPGGRARRGDPLRRLPCFRDRKRMARQRPELLACRRHRGARGTGQPPADGEGPARRRRGQRGGRERPACGCPGARAGAGGGPEPGPRAQRIPGQHEPRDPHAHERRAGFCAHRPAATTTDPEKARHAFEKILVSGHQLLGVVNGILDFSKIDAGKLQIEANEVALHGVLDDAIQLVAERARAKGLELRLRKAANLPRACIGDALRLGQILLNLLSNAIKFTETGKVTLAAELEAGQLVFRVTDTGIGMTAEQLGSLFNPFQQADGSTTRRFGGTGLGLAICKRLLELMQGEIRVESRPGRGSVFEARVPYVPLVDQAPSADSDRAVPLSDQALRGVSILLAEDDEINRAMLEVNLLEAGARLVMVEDGAQAVERVRLAGPQGFDLVLMDIQMPVMDGYEAARRILQMAPALPIIGQTAHAFHEDRDKCLAAGMVGHVAKPIDPPALIKLMLQVLAGRRAGG
jgi:CheY-like chemotaxis protein/PAS domain-containing protein/anti-sigma regulatory factor (Ser/Thr protein kinase)